MNRVITRLGQVFLTALILCVFSSVVRAGTVHGAVKNGTTGKPAAGVQVILIQLQGGMQPVANTQSDAKGQFTFDNPSLGAQPMLVRAVYRGINFHQPVPPGKSDVEVTVFEPTKDAKAIAVTTRVVFFQPNGASLIVGEEYSLQNDTQPPEAYFRADGNFDFAVPEKAQLQQIAASGPAGMPVVQATIDKSNGHFAIAYAFRPGENMVRYSYEIPYPNNTIALKIPPSPYTVRRLLVVAPPTVQISGEGLMSGGQEQGMNVYGRENLAANATVAVMSPAPRRLQCEQRRRHWRWSGPGSPGRARRYRRRKHSARSRASRRSQMAAGRGLRRRFCRRRIFVGAQASTCHRCGQ